MHTQMVFRRYEQKYFLTREQKALLLWAMEPHMRNDIYGRTTIRNIYFDTENYRLIRRSIEKPVYKEKLRIRSYRKTPPGEDVFVELKKKYRKVVFKRRVLLPEQTAMDWICHGHISPCNTQIAREIEYFRDLYGPLYPAVFLAYEREAYFDRGGEDLRVTFDENIRARTAGLSTGMDDRGELLMMEDRILMEIKSTGGIPLWLTRLLSEQRLFCTPFSKYGMAYSQLLFPKGGHPYAEIPVSGAV